MFDSLFLSSLYFGFDGFEKRLSRPFPKVRIRGFSKRRADGAKH
jgi:hypothetical protein